MPSAPDPAISCRAIDHFAFTVPDLDQAADFFVAVLGARELYRRTYAPAPGGSTEMAEKFNAHPEASCRLSKLELCGHSVELFEYSAPDLRTDVPRNCDAGGSHIGLMVANFDAALARLESEPGVRLLGEPSRLPDDHPLGGRRWIYFLAPWGLQIELVWSPDGT